MNCSDGVREGTGGEEEDDGADYYPIYNRRRLPPIRGHGFRKSKATACTSYQRSVAGDPCHDAKTKPSHAAHATFVFSWRWKVRMGKGLEQKLLLDQELVPGSNLVSEGVGNLGFGFDGTMVGLGVG